MDPVTMMVASIGMQFFTQYATSKKNAEIQGKQREFQKAAAEHDFERMRKLQAESARLALELEAEVHKERVEDINNNYDVLLENFAHSFAIQNWPLNVLPFVMKGESFGSLFNGTIQSVNMHCILTPSNCEWFNEMFYDDVDLQLEAELNNNWNAQTTHPVVYYGGGWNRRTMRHGISVPNEINLVDIDLLKVKLKNIPVVAITPYFDPWLHFRVQLWGMGKNSDAPFRIDIPHGDDIEYSKKIFSYDYNKDDKNEMTKDFLNTTIEEFVPYLESMIGFIADKYFWSVYRLTPMLPFRLVDKEKSEHKFLQFYKEKYQSFLTSCQEDDGYPLEDVKIFRLIESMSAFLDRQSCSQIAEEYFINKCSPYAGTASVQNCIETSAQIHSLIPLLKEFVRLVPEHSSEEIKEWLQNVDKNNTNGQEDYVCFEVSRPSIDIVKELANKQQKLFFKPRYFCFCIWNNYIVIGEFLTYKYLPSLCNEMHRRSFIIMLNNCRDFSPLETVDFYQYELLTKNIEIMESKNQKFVSDLRKRFGHILIKHGQKLAQEEVSQNSPVGANPWKKNTETSFSNAIFDDVINYFTHAIDTRTVDTQNVERGMSISLVLNWLDSLTITNENKLYLIKGFVKEHNCFIYCAVLAVDNQLLMKEGTCKCFICPTENDEMKEVFGNSNIYIIPFTD